MTTYSSPEAKKFFTWFDNISAKAYRSRVGTIAVANGFTVLHTGGGCLAWEKTNAQGYHAWITHEGSYLGEDFRDTEKPRFDVGIYSADGDRFYNPDYSLGFTSAVAWCNDALADPEKWLFLNS